MRFERAFGLAPYAAALLVSFTAQATLLPERDRLSDFDSRSALQGQPLGVTPAQRSAEHVLKQRLANVQIDFDELLGTPRFVRSRDGFLTGPAGEGRTVKAETARRVPVSDPDRSVKNFLNEYTGLFGHGAEALANVQTNRDFVTEHNGMRTVVWQQQVDGIPVFGALLIAHTTEKGELVNVSSRFLADAGNAANVGTPNASAVQAAPPISARQAVALAAQNIGETLDAAAVSAVEPTFTGREKRQQFRASVLLGDTDARLVWMPLDRTQLRLCWEIILMSRARSQMFRVLIDAQTGTVLLRQGLTEDISDATYRVFTSDSPSPYSPACPTPCTTQPSVVPRSLVTLSALDTTASPNGWINDGDNTTAGNNVDAHLDKNANDTPDAGSRPTGSPFRVFDCPLDLSQEPVAYTNAAVVQLFYWNNWMHDKLYQLGFTEAAGNFQANNFGRGGLGNDAVQADAQDGSGFNNANFSTPSDGSAGRMQMYLFNGSTPDRDGDFDADVVLHEYTHGLSNRRVGGGVGLSALQSRGMGEGWSDFYALSLLSEPGDDVNGNYAAGAYVTYQLSGMTQNYYFGIRRYPYSTDMTKNPLTFKDIDPVQASSHTGIPRSPIVGSTANEVHNMGEVWCVTLWEVRARLITKYGYAVGNQLILQLVTDGMNLSPANPNFLQARDAILQADQVDTGGANRSELWTAFAKRGMGYSATSPPSSTTTGLVEAYDFPDFLSVTPTLGFNPSGPIGGPFSPSSQTYALANTGTSTLSWTATKTAAWLDLSGTGGTLTTGSTNTVATTINASANGLAIGNYSDTVTFSNLVSGVVQMRAVSLTVTAPRLYFFSLDSDPGWSRQGEWAFGKPTGQGGALHGFHDPTSGATGTNVFGINLNGDYSTVIGGPYYLTAGPLNFGGYTGAKLQFQRWLNTDYPLYVYATVEVSSNGTTWTQIFSNLSGVEIADSAWSKYQYDISAVADNQTNVYVRWSHRVASSGAFAYSGWNIDDIEFFANPTRLLHVQAPASVTEGNGVLIGQGQLTVTPAPTNDLTVSLTSSDTSEITVPPTVVIPSGQTNVAFNITVVDDAELDGTQTANISAAAATYTGANVTISVNDNENTTLTVAAPANATEGAGVLVSAGTVYVGTPVGTNVTVTLSSSDTTELTVPATVIILPGQTNASFNITIVDDAAIDGSQTATITAHVQSWVDGSNSVIVLDNDYVNLAVTPVSGLSSTGPQSGPFTPSSQVYALSNTGPGVMTWSATMSAAWLTAAPAGGMLPGGAGTNVTVSINANANTLFAGSYTDVVSFANLTNGDGSTNRPVVLTVQVAPPTANFSATPTNGLAPLMVTFTDNSTGTITNSFWSFGDGGTTNVNGASLQHIYAALGSYTVSLVASGPLGTSALTRTNLITVTPVPPCVSPPSGLVSWWPGDGAPNDSQGGNTGKLTNNVTFAVGVVGPAFQFGGDKAAVVVGNPVNLQLQDFTIDAWVKRADSTRISIDHPSNGQVFAYGTGGYGFGLEQIGTACRLFLTKVGFSATISSGPQLTDLAWHHVAVTKSNSEVIFFVDGVASAVTGYNPGFSFTTSAAIGARGDVTNSILGSLDEVEVFNRALSTSEIQTIFNANAGGKCKTCVAPPSDMLGWWPGDGNAKDIQGGHHGVLTNGTTFAAGMVAQAFRFDGVNDAVVIGNPINLQLQSFTIDAWIRRASANQVTLNGSDGELFTYGTNGYAFALHANGRLFLSKVAVSEVTSSILGVTDTNLHHVAVTKTGTAVIFYVDGVAETVAAYDPGFEFTTQAAIGAQMNPLAGNFYGDIDEVEVFSRALSASEIQAILSAGAAGKCKSTGLVVSPSTALTSSGPPGGGFIPDNQVYTLVNNDTNALNWSVGMSAAWVSSSATNGTLAGGASTNVTVSINSNANGLATGTYSNTVTFTNLTTGDGSANRFVILAVATPAFFGVGPTNGLSSTGILGGPFAPSSQVYALTNSGGSTLNWSASKTASWVTLSTTSGALPAGGGTTVTVSINANANSLAVGGYADTITFTNVTNAVGSATRNVSLTISPAGVLSVSPTTGLVSGGPESGPFAPSNQIYALTNSGSGTLNWSASKLANWVTLSSTNGTLAPGGSTTVTASINANANALAAGSYADTITFANTTGGYGTTTRSIALAVTARANLMLTPAIGLTAAGTLGGPFTSSSQVYTLSNTGDNALAWSASKTANWVTVSPASGSLLPGGSTPVTVSINANANGLSLGNYADTVTFTNTVNGAGTTARAVSLAIHSANLALTKTASVEPATLGQPLTYTLVVTNAGPDRAPSVTVTDTLPLDLIFVSATTTQGACTNLGGLVICNLGTLSGGDTATAQITVLPTVLSSVTNIIFQDTFDIGYTDAAVHSDLDTNVNLYPFGRQGGGSVTSTYVMYSNNSSDVVGIQNDAVTSNSFHSNALIIRPVPASSGADAVVDLTTDFGASLSGRLWQVSFSARQLPIGSNPPTERWLGLAVGSTINGVGGDADLSFYIQPIAEDTNVAGYVVYTNGTEAVSGLLPLALPGVRYSLQLTVDETLATPLATLSLTATNGVTLPVALPLAAALPLLNLTASSTRLLEFHGHLGWLPPGTDYQDNLVDNLQIRVLPPTQLINRANATFLGLDPNPSNNFASTANTVIGPAPSANFVGSPTNGSPPLTVMFTDLSTGGISNRFWSFGDGVATNITALTIQHAYLLEGNYTVTLTTSGPQGAGTLTKTNLIVVGPIPPCVPPPSGLVSWWPGDGAPNDVRGGNTGKLTNNVTYATGMVGPAFQFDGDKDAVVVGNPSTLQLQTFTIDAWVKRADATHISLDHPSDGQVFAYGSGGFGFGLSQTGTACRLFLTKVGLSAVISGGPQLTDLNWHHVAVTKSNSVVIFYVDGVSTVAPSYDPGFSFSTSAAIGARGDVTNSILGSLDEVEVFNRALSTSEIQAIYNAGANGKCKPTGMTVDPSVALVSTGPMGSGFIPASQLYTLLNTGTIALNWSANGGAIWVSLSATNGTLAGGAATNVTVSINTNANNLAIGVYSNAVAFTNLTNGDGSTSRLVALTVAGPITVGITPTNALIASGIQGGPFAPSSQVYALTNSGGGTLNWSANKTASWVTLSATSGSLPPGSNTTVTVSINANANSLAAGGYADTVTFTNTTNGAGSTARSVSLTIGPAGTLSVSPTAGLMSSGLQGGPFASSNQVYTLSNSGGTTLNWTASKAAGWLTLSATSGSLLPGSNTTVTVSINANANSLDSGGYGDTVSFTNTTNGGGSTTRSAALTVIGEPQLSVTPTSYDFGAVIVGQSSNSSFQVVNIGTGTLTGSATVASPFSVLSGGNYSLGAGQSAQLIVSFSPGTAGTFNNAVAFNSNGGNLTVPVTGVAGSIPMAGFVGSPTYGLVPLIVTFTDSSTGTITNRSWSFGDGATTNTTATTIQHTYTSSHLNTVSLIVSGPVGVSTNTRTDYILATNMVADVTLTKTASSEPATLGQPLTYTLTVRNTGPDLAPSVTVTDTLPLDLIFVSATTTQGACTNLGGLVICNLGTLSGGDTATAQITVLPTVLSSVTNIIFQDTFDIGYTDAAVHSDLDTNVNLYPFGRQGGGSVTSTYVMYSNNSSDVVGIQNDAVTSNSFHSNALIIRPVPASSGADAVVDLTTDFGASLSGRLWQVSFSARQLPIGSNPPTERWLGLAVGSTINGVGGDADLSFYIQPIAEDTNVAGYVVYTNGTEAVSGLLPLALPGVRYSLQLTVDETLATPLATLSLTATNGVTLPVALPLAAALPLRNLTANSTRLLEFHGHLGWLPPGTDYQDNLVDNLKIATIPKEPLVNQATAAFVGTDPDLSNNSASVTNTVIASTPAANFVGNPTNGLVPLTVTFTDLSTGGINNRFWDFGDGVATNLNAVTVQHTYTSLSLNTVRLTVSGPVGVSTNIQVDYILVTNTITDLALSKTASPEPVILGQPLTYTLTVTNTGGSFARSVTITDALPSAVTFVSAVASQGSCTNIAGLVACDLGTLSGNAAATVSIVVTAPAVECLVTNTGTMGANVIDPNSANNSARAISTAQGISVLTVTPGSGLTAGGLSGGPFAPTNQVYALTNTGNGRLTWSAGHSSSWVTLSATNGFLAVGGGTTVTVSINTNANTLAPGSYVDSVTFTNLTNGNGTTARSVMLTVIPNPQLSVAPASYDFGPVAVGQSSNVSFQVVNIGTGTLTGNATVGSPFSVLSGGNYSLGAGQTGQVLVSFSPLATGTFSTAVNFNSNGGSTSKPVTGSASYTAFANFVGSPTYGLVPLTVTFTDSSTGTITNRSWSFGDGATTNTTTTTVQHTYVSQHLNTVRLIVSGPINVSTNTRTDYILATNIVANLALTKTASPEPVNLGQLLTYTLTVTNAGPDLVSSVTVTDALPKGLTFLSATSSQGSCSNSNGRIICDLGTLPSGAIATMQIIMQPMMDMLTNIIFQDTFDIGYTDAAVHSDLDTNVNLYPFGRQGGGSVTSTYVMYSNNSSDVVGIQNDAATSNSFHSNALIIRPVPASSGADAVVDLTTDFGASLSGRLWQVSFSARQLPIGSNPPTERWLGLAVGSTINGVGGDADLSFYIQPIAEDTNVAGYVVYTNGTEAVSGLLPLALPGVRYSLQLTVDETLATPLATLSLTATNGVTLPVALPLAAALPLRNLTASSTRLLEFHGHLGWLPPGTDYQDNLVDNLQIRTLPANRPINQANVTFFGIDPDVSNNTASVTNTVIAAAPVADFVGSPTSGSPPLTVLFTDLSTGGISNRFWSFGDGATTNITALTVQHSYTSPNLNTVRLIVSGPAGVSTNTKTGYIMVWTPFTAWQVQYFGCTDCSEAAAGADPDGDGQNNLAEFLAGTDPTKSTSALRIIGVSQEANNMRITWATVGGHTNRLQATAGDAVGGYATNFNDISGLIIISGSGDTTTNQIDVGGATNAPSRFYRVRLVP